MKRKNKLKWLTMSVVALGAISVVPIITTSCSNEKEPEDYSNEEISDDQYQEQADTIADIKAAIEEIRTGTYSRALSEVVSEIKSYEYFDVFASLGVASDSSDDESGSSSNDNESFYNDDGSYNDSYISWLKTSIYNPFEYKNILLSYDQSCILIDSDYEYWGEENTLQEEDYYAFWIYANINLIAFLDNKENLLLLPYFDEDWERIDGTWDLDLMYFVWNSVLWVQYFLYDEPDISWNFTSFFNNYYELAEYLYYS